MTTESAVDSPWMTVRDIRAYAKVGHDIVLGALADGSLRGTQLKPGGKWRVHRDDVDAWLRGEQPPVRNTSFTRRSV